MILPARRRLRIRADFVRGSWGDAVWSLAPAIALLAVVAVWQGRAAASLVGAQRTWARGAPVAVVAVRPQVTVIQAVAYHVRVRATVLEPDGTERVVWDDYYALFSDGIDEGVPDARLDPATGRVALSWGVRAAPWRWAAIGLIGGMLGLLGGAFAASAIRRLHGLRTARAAARCGREVELEVLEIATREMNGRETHVELRYRAPPPPPPTGGYRDNVRPPAGEERVARFEIGRPGPLLLDGGDRVLAVRAAEGSSRVVIVAEDFGPFELDAAEREAARARLVRRAAQPPSVDPASSGGPASGIGTHSPSSSKI